MNVVAIACARDEIDVIEPFVRHTVRTAARLIVLDNGSTDGTRDVLSSLQHEGLPLDVIDDPSPGKYLSRRLTRLMQEEAIGRWHADWIVPLDADEFLAVAPGHELVPSGLDAAVPLLLPWRSYVPRHGDRADERNPLLRIRHRLAAEPHTLSKVIAPADLGRLPTAAIAQGSHALTIDGQPHPSRSHPHAYLAHYPIRSAAQFVVKTVLGHLQNEVMPYRDSFWGWHHRNHYELLKQDPAAFLARVPDLASRYSRLVREDAGFETVDDPIEYLGGPLRYTPPASDMLAAWPPVLRYVQDLARRCATLTASLPEEGRGSVESQTAARVFLIEHLAERDRLLETLLTERATLADDLSRLQSSWTWKAGRAVLWPGRVLKRMSQNLRS